MAITINKLTVSHSMIYKCNSGKPVLPETRNTRVGLHIYQYSSYLFNVRQECMLDT